MTVPVSVAVPVAVPASVSSLFPERWHTPVLEWSPRLRGAGIELPVVFVPQAPKGHRSARRRRVDYDTEIVEHARVPSREGNAHDFFNMAMWVTYPRAKLALHRRQRVEAMREGPHAPGKNRGQARDALAMLDEGGVLCVEGRDAEPAYRLFGHATAEHFERAGGALWAFAWRVQIEGSALPETELVDQALSRALEQIGEDELRRQRRRVLVRGF